MIDPYCKPLIWKVKYNYDFESSSTDTGRYCNHYLDQCGIVWTAGHSLDDVIKAIQDGLGCQSKVTKLISAEYMGTTLNYHNA